MYQFWTFDGVALPVQDHEQDHDPTQAESTIVDSVSGAFDWLGSTRRRGRRQVISLTGKFSGEVEKLVDESGEIIVDENGDAIILGSAQQWARAQVVALLEKRGVRGSLWRKRLDDDVLQWKTARLLSIPWARTWEDRGLLAELSCQFETRMDGWRDQSSTSDSQSCSDGVGQDYHLDNGGSLPIHDAVITVTRTSGTITQVDIDATDLGIDLRWTGSLGSSDVLTIDTGAQTVRKNSSDAYSGFSLQSGHSAAGWLPLALGINTVLVTVTGGGATVKFEYYGQYP